MVPDVNETIRDPGLGIIPASSGRVQVKAGACSKAAPNVVLPLSTMNAAKNALGSGPLLDCVVAALDVGGGPVLALPLSIVSQGTVTGSFVQTGTGAGTVAGSTGPEAAIAVKVILGGALGTATFQVKIGAGGYGPTVTTGTPGPWSYQVPGAYLTTLVFAAGTYVANDVYTVNTDGSVTRVGTGTSTLLNGTTSSTVDSTDVWVTITTSGALGAATFTYSLDGGKTTSANILVPASGKYVIPGAGILLTFASTFVAGDVYKGTSTPPGFTSTEVNTGLTALLANPLAWGWVHVVGQPASAAASASLAAVVDAQVSAAFTAHRPVFGVVECPQAEGDTTIAAAFVSAGFQSTRTAVVVGDTDLQSRLLGRQPKRSLAWAATARLGAIKLSTDPARFDNGALKNVTGIYRDEAATPGLDDAGFVTARTFTGVTGYYLNNFPLMSPPGSDFKYVMSRRVMDRACVLAHDAYLLYLNADVNIDKTTGYIDERDAQKVDGNVNTKLETGLVSEQEVSAVSSSLSRTDNLLSSPIANAEVNVIPKGYLKAINVSMGFQNPVIQQLAAAA